MEVEKSQIILNNLNRIAKEFQLEHQFWTRLEQSKIFPRQYVHHLQALKIDPENLKKNLLIDITRRETTSYREFSKILLDLYKSRIMDHLATDRYPISKQGYCVIINNQQYENGQIDRIGSDLDVEKFLKEFEKLNYQVDIHGDLSLEKMKELLSQICEDGRLKLYDIFVLIIMSHGRHERIVTIDEQEYSYDAIRRRFNNKNCPLLSGKPKIFIYNCCRIRDTTCSDQILADGDQEDSAIGPDLVEIFSTLDNYLSLRDEEKGTLFADAFIESMRQCSGSVIDEIVRNADKLLTQQIQQESNKLEPRQTIEIRKLGVQKSVYFK